MINASRTTLRIDGDFVIFLIGMRINRPWRVDKWLPVAGAMPRMLKELSLDPNSGLLGYETWFGRTIIYVQYWRSSDQLMTYAKNRDAAHLPAWRAFNQAVGTGGDVGIWHETYLVKAAAFENSYVNMPPFGMAKFGQLAAATGRRQTAEGRLDSSGANDSSPAVAAPLQIG